jgi:hypothetical protein
LEANLGTVGISGSPSLASGVRPAGGIGDIFAAALGSSAPARVTPAAATSDDTPVSLGVVNGEHITLDWVVGKLLVHKKEIDSMRSSAYAQGVKVENFHFECLEDVVALLTSEEIDPTTFPGCCDCMSMWAHYASGNEDSDKVPAEIKTARAAGLVDAVSCKYIATFRQKHPPYLLGDSGSAVAVGKRFPLLNNRTAWQGTPSMTGGRKSFLEAVKDTSTNLKQYNVDFLPMTSVVRPLNLCLGTRSGDWWNHVVKFIDEELVTLEQWGIPEEKVYILVCDELQIMLRKIFEKRMKLPVFAANRDPVVYMARCIFITMQAHMVMDEFLDLNFGTHVLISSLFTRFLAEQTGNNFASGVSKHFEELRKEIAEVRKNSDTKSKAITGRLDRYLEALRSVETKCKVTLTKE